MDLFAGKCTVLKPRCGKLGCKIHGNSLLGHRWLMCDLGHPVSSIQKGPSAIVRGTEVFLVPRVVTTTTGGYLCPRSSG